MKISDAWAELRLQEAQYKILSFFVAITAILSILLNLIISQRKPLIVERGCASQALKLSTTDPTIEEVKTFLSLALGQRFNTSETSSTYLSEQQSLLKHKEIEEMKSRKIHQYVLSQKIEVTNDSAIVELDRIISIGTVKSALGFIIHAKFVRVSRSVENPYGLILIETKKALSNLPPSINKNSEEEK